MYNQTYDEYIRSILGYPPESVKNPYRNDELFQNINYELMTDDNEYEDYYPEIYRIVNPMIVEACNNNTKPITREVINEIATNIYENVEYRENSNETNMSQLKNSIANTKNLNASENMQTRNRPNNYLLRDLIKILLIRELYNRKNKLQPARPPIRPPVGPGRMPIYPQYF